MARPRDKISTAEMECVLSNYFDYRANLVVPNVHWGMNMHECDLLILSKAGYVTECEIKISKSDLLADAKKVHGHRCAYIKKLFFAIPTYLEDCIEHIPPRAGIITVSPKDKHHGPRCRKIRNPQISTTAWKMSDSDHYKIARLGALRIWRLKRKILDLS